MIGLAVALLAGAAIALWLIFRSADPFKPDTSLIPFFDGKKWGYVDKKGAVAIPATYQAADLFSDGRARVQTKDGKWGFIDEKGNSVISFKYADATIFHDGLAFVVEEGGRPYCIDKNGKKVFDCTTAEAVCCFCDGLARFYTIEEDKEDGKVRKYGFMDKKGNIVITPQFRDAENFFDGLAAVCNEDEQWGFIDKKGKMVINYQFEHVYGFTDGLAACCSSDDKWGFIDKKGKYVINPQFDYVFPFFDGKAVVYQDENCGVIDKKGKFIINPQFDHCEVGFMYGEKLLAVCQDDKWGYVDKKGKMVINPQFDAAGVFCDGKAVVRSGDKYGIIDKKGQYIVNPQYDRMPDLILNLDYMVQSQFYDASKFLNAFMEDFSSSEVDGMSVSNPTLRDVRDNWHYNTSFESSLYSYSSSISVSPYDEITDEISLSTVKYDFDGQLYSREFDWDYYEYYNTYYWDRECTSVKYDFSLQDQASNRSKTICVALANKLRSIYGGTLSDVKEDNEEDDDYYYHDNSYFKKLECGRVNFVIEEQGSGIILRVYFDENEYQSYIDDRNGGGYGDYGYGY